MEDTDHNRKFSFGFSCFLKESQSKSLRISQNKDEIITIQKVLKPYHGLQRSHHYNYTQNCKDRSRVSEDLE